MRKCEHILVETDSRVTASGSEPVQAAPVVYLSAMTSNQGRPARQKATFLPVQIFFLSTVTPSVLSTWPFLPVITWSMCLARTQRA